MAGRKVSDGFQFEIKDNTRNVAHVDAAKSDTTGRVYLATLVYHRSMEVEDEDFEQFKAYLNLQVAKFFQGRFLETLQCSGQELFQYGPPKLKFEPVMELNKKGYLHHHVVIEMTFKRIMDESNGKLMRWGIDYRDFNRVFREAMDLGDPKEGGIAIKIDLRDGKTNTLQNMINYVMKKSDVSNHIG